ncbi:hypothetical protein [Mesorhizobium sp. A623]
MRLRQGQHAPIQLAVLLLQLLELLALKLVLQRPQLGIVLPCKSALVSRIDHIYGERGRAQARRGPQCQGKDCRYLVP